MMMISNTLGDQSLSGLNIQNGNEKSMKFRGTLLEMKTKTKNVLLELSSFLLAESIASISRYTYLVGGKTVVPKSVKGERPFEFCSVLPLCLFVIL